MPFKLPAIRFFQKGTMMFLAALPIAELDLCRIDTWDPRRTSTWKGYQRSLIKSKISDLAEYLERPDSILPVAGLLDVRQKKKLIFSNPKGNRPTAGILTIPDETQLWVVDMQHRLEGIKIAHSKGLLKQFSVPVLITEGLSEVKEAAQFYIINTKSKRMGVDLTRRLLIEHDEIRDLTDVPVWELKAVKISILLSRHIRGNPWYQRIREPETERLRDQIATEKSFVPSLQWLLTAPVARAKSTKHLARFLANYLEGIRANMPEAFITPRAYILQKTPGFMSFHRLAPIVYRKYGRGSPAEFTKLFSPLSGRKHFGHKFWYGRNLKGAKRYGAGQSAFSNLAMDLKKAIRL